MPGPLGRLGTVDGFGLRAVDEVEQLVHVPVVDGARHGRVRVLPLRQLLLAPRQPRTQLLPDLGVVPTGRRCRRLKRRKRMQERECVEECRKRDRQTETIKPKEPLREKKLTVNLLFEQESLWTRNVTFMGFFMSSLFVKSNSYKHKQGKSLRTALWPKNSQ